MIFRSNVLRTPFAVAAALVLVMGLGAAARAGDDEVQLTLTYSEHKGLSGPFSGSGDFAMGSTQAGFAAAGVMKTFNSVGKILEALNSGQEIKVPKTTGESVREMTDQALAKKAAALPRNTGYRGTLNATLSWDEKEKAYLVKNGTFQWSAFNSSRWQGGEHLQFTNLTVSGTHKLAPKEVKIKFPRKDLSASLDRKPREEAPPTYTLALNLAPKPETVTGNAGWVVGKNIYEIKEKYTKDGVQIISKGGGHKDPPYLYKQKIHYKAEEREIHNGRAGFSEEWLDSGGTWHFISWSAYLRGQVVADAGGPYRVERCGTVTLDAANSKGRIDKYKWKLKANDAGAPAGMAMPNAAVGGTGGGASDAGSVMKEGERVEEKVLETFTSELEVDGGAGRDKDTRTCNPDPRESFRTKYDLANHGERTMPFTNDPKATVNKLRVLPVQGAAIAITMCGGEPWTKIEEWQNVHHVVHVPDRKNEKTFWDGQAYVLKQFENSGGTCHHHWYVGEPKFTINRVAYMNPYFDIQGPVPPGAKPKEMNWYRANAERRKKFLEEGGIERLREAKEKLDAQSAAVLGDENNYDPDYFLQKVREHERLHTQLIIQKMQDDEFNPGMAIEGITGKPDAPPRQDVWEKLGLVDKDLVNVGDELDSPSGQEKYLLWQGWMLFWNEQSKSWEMGLVKI